ncbi:MAG: AAA family ATPase [Chloroflexota bacterium]|nr:AAA family ATPase [Chloroflexota bacterium]
MATRAKSPFVENEYDELDRKIDGFLGRVGALFRFFVILGALIAFTYFILWPNLETWGSYLLFGLYMIFQLFFAVMFMIVQFAALFWFLGRTRVYWIMPGETGVTFKDYKGNPEILELAERVVTLLRGVKGFKEMGGQVHRGMLLVGPPGTGKSYLAQCIASEAGVPFAYASAPSFQSMFMGISNIKVMMLYGKARKLARKYGACIIFMDEIDAIAMRRGGQGGMMPGMGGFMGMGGNTGLLNELLMQMDPPPTDQGRKARLLRKMGFRVKKAEMPAVFTMGATNLAEVLDPALLRPGRFDWKISVERPSAVGRREVLDYYLAKIKHVPDLPVDRLVTEMMTPEGQGYSPVEIKFVVNEAVVHAHFDGREAVTYMDFRKAMETREYGLRQMISGRTAEDKRRVAYHEAGHAITMIRLYTRKRLDRLTLMQYGELRGAEGVAFDKAIEEIHITTREELLTDIQIFLASKAAEQVFLGTETTGMGGDLPGASFRALQYVRCGMGGNLFTFNFWGEPTPQERATAERIMQQQLSLARQLMEQNKPHVHAIVEALLEKDELLGEEVEEIVARVDRELGRGEVPKHLVPVPAVEAPALPEPEPVVRYAGARRASEEREREVGGQGVASREPHISRDAPPLSRDVASSDPEVPRS